MDDDQTCKIWRENAKVGPLALNADKVMGSNVESPRAGGKYWISDICSQQLSKNETLLRIKLTNWIVDENRLGNTPKITQEIIAKVKSRPNLNVHKRADRLLRYLLEETDLLGKVVSFYVQKGTKSQETEQELLAWTGSQKISEVIELAEYCGQQKWIEHRVTDRKSTSSNNLHQIKLLPPGYARLAELDGPNPKSAQGFVAMWFNDSMTDAYENGIKPAIKASGYAPQRIDTKQHNNKICDEIIAEIRRSRFLVADLTAATIQTEKQKVHEARGGVYYEAGFAAGLNIPVIYTCRENVMNDNVIHFDIRQYNTISWKDPADLLQKLQARIGAIIGNGPLQA